jgi:hypothetical protein
MGLHGLLQGRGMLQDVLLEYASTDLGKLRKTCSSMADVPTEIRTGRLSDGCQFTLDVNIRVK